MRPWGLQVRAQSLQELVYKQGSAGITKASVSITFHNDDPANGPSGYEDKELITVTRQVTMSAFAWRCGRWLVQPCQQFVNGSCIKAVCRFRSDSMLSSDQKRHLIGSKRDS